MNCDCNRGLVNGVVCEKCHGTGFIEEKQDNVVEKAVKEVKEVKKEATKKK